MPTATPNVARPPFPSAFKAKVSAVGAAGDARATNSDAWMFHALRLEAEGLLGSKLNQVRR